MLAIKKIDEILKSNKISHAYIFNSINLNELLDISKDFIKKILEKEQNFSEERIIIIEPENAIIKKEQIIFLQKKLSTKNEGKRFYILKEAEKLNASAFNSVLKFLEEPEEDIVAILLTKNYLKLPETIISRCQLIMIGENINKKEDISINEIFSRQGLKIEEEKINAYYENMLRLVLILFERKFEALIEVKNIFSDNISTREELLANLHVLLYIYRNCYISKEKGIITKEDFCKWLNKDRYLSISKILLNNINLVDSNVNQRSIIDKLIIEISEVN